MPRNRRAFSLIELLVVVSIIALLASMMLGAIGLVRAGAQTVACAGNLRQFGLAFGVYVEDSDHCWPTGDWNALLQPYVDEGGAIGVVGGVPAASRLARYAAAPRMTAVGVQLGATYAYTGHYYDSFGLNGVPYYFAWSAVWFTPPEMRTGAADARLVRRTAKAVLCETWDDFNPGVGNACWGKSQLCAEQITRVHRQGSNVLAADGHVQFVPMPGFTPSVPRNLPADAMWFPYRDADSAFLQ